MIDLNHSGTGMNGKITHPIDFTFDLFDLEMDNNVQSLVQRDSSTIA